VKQQSFHFFSAEIGEAETNAPKSILLNTTRITDLEINALRPKLIKTVSFEP
jgi:hypothetical protein